MKFLIYKDAQNFFRWKLIAANGRNVANGGEGFTKRVGVQRSIACIKRALANDKYLVIDTTKRK